MAEIVVIQGPAAGKRLALETSLSVGRSTGADIRTSDRRDPDAVAEIESGKEGFFLRPRGRVELNGRPCRGSPLRHGDLVQVGDTILFFSEEAGGPDEAMALEIGSAPDLPHQDVQARTEAYGDFHSFLENAALPGGHDKRLEVLYKVSSATFGEDDLDSFLARVLDTLFDALSVDTGVVLLLSRDGQRVIPAAMRGVPDGKRVHLSRSVIKETFRSRQSILCMDLRTDQRFKRKKSVRLMKTKSLMCAPLISGDETVGLLQVSGGHPAHPWTKDDLDLLTGVALITSTAVQKVRLHQQTKRFSQALIILSRVSREISAHLERAPIIRESVLAGMRLLAATRGSFLLLEEDGAHLKVAHRVGHGQGGDSPWRIPEGKGLAWKAIRERAPVLVSHIETQVPPELRSPGDYQTSSLLIVPVMTPPRRRDERERVVGALAITDKIDHGIFSEDDREILQILANQIGVSLANAELYERATLDGLTRLYVRRFLFLRLEEEVEYHIRRQRPLSMLMIDIDRFKEVNDTAGHPAGDEVLQRVTATIRASLRPGDIPGRYGGEEFAVVLPGAPADQAAQIGERIRRGVEELRIPWDGRELTTTVSVGVAELGEASQPDELLAAADRALYRAKEAGRNRVEVASVEKTPEPS